MPLDLGPDARSALTWALVVALVAFGGLLLKRWLLQHLDALERIPPRAWFEEVSESLGLLATKAQHDVLAATVVQHGRTLDNHELRITQQGEAIRTDHGRLGDVVLDVGYAKTLLDQIEKRQK